MNSIVVSGKVKSAPTLSHECKNEKFYSFQLATERLSGAMDILNCLVSEVYVDDIFVDDSLTIVGEVRTQNRHENGKSKLDVFVFVKEVQAYPCHDDNEVDLVGYIVKPPVYRKTPLGREICDLIVASNRQYGKSDYIPCICWGRGAKRASQFVVGSNITLKGRLQSREYTKVLDNGTSETRVAYELSIKTISEIVCE